MAQLQLHWLGSPGVELDDHPLHLEMRKALALLAYLSLSPQYPTRETLAAMLWPEFDQGHALANLRRSLSSLAKALPPGLLEADRETIGVKKVSWLAVDVEAFRQQVSFPHRHSHSPGGMCRECIAHLEQAAAIYRGDFFQGFTLRDCPEFDDWQAFQQEQLRSQYAEALHQLATFYQSQRQWEKAIGYTQSWLALDRLNETAQRTLIHLYQQSAQPGLALRQYESWAGLLQDELGQAPDAEMQAVYQGLLPVKETGAAENRPPLTQLTGGEPETLLKTKLFIPASRVERVVRPRLFDRLDAGSQRALTLVSAPPGAGKTILLASWTAHTQLPIAWLSLDEGDNDPARFLAYLIAALDSVVPGDLHAQFAGFAQALQTSIQPAVVKLINHLAAVSEPFVLILDDYQVIRSPAVEQALAFLVERIPACMRLFIATRSDPGFSLARLRARDQLVEIRMSDLRFRLDETTSFLQQVMALDLSEEDVTALEARTEGWIAGLQMAALAIRTVAAHPLVEADEAARRLAVARYIRSFTGSDRYILDFLGEEVLNRHPENVRRFLLHTSILERFCGPLCDAVTETEGSQRVIEALERENLFLVPLDSERRWYRYHHLFSELLRFNLEQAISKGSEIGGEGLPTLETLHLHAAEWLEKEQFFAEAVHHWIAAKKFDRAADLINHQTYPMLLTTGQIYTLETWLSALPEALYRSRPHLAIARAWTLILRNQFAATSGPLEAACQAVEGHSGAEADSVLGEIALVRGVLAELSTRDSETMRRQGMIAWEKLPPGDARLRGLAAWLIGAADLFDGDIQSAEGYLSEAIRLCQAAGNIFFTSVAILDLSNVRNEQGRWREAYHLLRQAIDKLSAEGWQAHPSLGYLHTAICQILLDWNELGEAEQHLVAGIDLVTQDLPDEVFLTGSSILPYLKLAQGKTAEAIRLAEECLRRVEAYPLPFIPATVRADLVRFWIRVGDRARIQAWLATNGLSPDGPIHHKREGEYLALVKALIWQGRPEEGLKILAQMQSLAQAQGRKGKLFYLLALQALAYQQANEPDRALKALEASLKLALPERHIRPYVDEGQPMEALLVLGAARGIWHPSHLDGYVSQLLKAIRQDRRRLEGVDMPADGEAGDGAAS